MWPTYMVVSDKCGPAQVQGLLITAIMPKFQMCEMSNSSHLWQDR